MRLDAGKVFALDYILLNLMLDNSTRTGALKNMTLQEFDSARKQDDGFVVSVRKHKTNYNGPVHMAISHDLYNHMLMYIQWRNKLPGITKSKDDVVFVSWNGNKTRSGMINTQFQRYWNNALGDTIGTITSTLVRKFTKATVYIHEYTQYIHEYNPNRKKRTAELLCHSEKTAEQHYALVEKSRNST